MKDNSQLINKVADKFTDTFNEQITDYLIAYDVEATEANINKVIDEIVKIYTFSIKSYSAFERTTNKN